MGKPVGVLRQAVVVALDPQPHHVTVQVGNVLVDVLCAGGVEVGDLVWVKFSGLHAWVEDKVRPGIPEPAPQYALGVLRDLVAAIDVHVVAASSGPGWTEPLTRARSLVAEHTTNEETT